MKQYVAALFITILTLIAGPGSCYAAFPIARHSAAVPAASSNAPVATNAPNQHTTATQHPDAPRRIRAKSQRWALVICCLVGYLGIHRYYLGYILEGCIQTVTLGGMGVWWVIDLIRICTGDLQPKDGKYMATF